jgi:hypothetical protein
MNKETTYRFIQIREVGLEKLEDKHPYTILCKNGTWDLLWKDEIIEAIHFVSEILLPVEENLAKQVYGPDNICIRCYQTKCICNNPPIFIGGVKVSDGIPKSTINIGDIKPNALSEVFGEEKQVRKEEVNEIKIKTLEDLRDRFSEVHSEYYLEILDDEIGSIKNGI